MTYSNLLNFFDDLEGMTVSYTNKSGATVTANALNIDEKADSIQTADLPCRIITQTAADSGTVLQGAGIKATWNITDLFLLDTIARDISPAIQMPVLQRYKVAYLEALSKKWMLPHPPLTEERTLSYTATTGKFEYPAGSGIYFYGVKFDLTLEEIF
jgi:hypothetical protein